MNLIASCELEPAIGFPKKNPVMVVTLTIENCPHKSLSML